MIPPGPQLGERVPRLSPDFPLEVLRCCGSTSACDLGWVGREGSAELTVAIAHEQYSMVNEPTAAERPQWVGDSMAVELRRENKQ